MTIYGLQENRNDYKIRVHTVRDPWFNSDLIWRHRRGSIFESHVTGIRPLVVLCDVIYSEFSILGRGIANTHPVRIESFAIWCTFCKYCWVFDPEKLQLFKMYYVISITLHYKHVRLYLMSIEQFIIKMIKRYWYSFLLLFLNFLWWLKVKYFCDIAYEFNLNRQNAVVGCFGQLSECKKDNVKSYLLIRICNSTP